jgi:hypothetical protein
MSHHGDAIRPNARRPAMDKMQPLHKRHRLEVQSLHNGAVFGVVSSPEAVLAQNVLCRLREAVAMVAATQRSALM